MSREHLAFWEEIDTELTGTGGTHLRSVRPTDDGWLRRDAYSPALDAACNHVAAREHWKLHRVTLQGARCRTTAEALRSIGDALEFPSYYGQNLDALDECLQELLIVEDGRIGAYYGDRVGRTANGLLLTVDNAQQLLGDESFDLTVGLMASFRHAAHPEPDPLGREDPAYGYFKMLLFDR